DGRRLDLGTALKRSTVLEALRSLRQKNLIEAHVQVDALTGTRPTVYALKLRQRDNDPGYDDDAHPGMPEHTPPYVLAYPPVRSGIPGGMLHNDRGVCQSIPGGYALAYPQETVKQKTVKQETVNSKFSKDLPNVDKVSPDPETDTSVKTEPLHSALIAQVVSG